MLQECGNKVTKSRVIAPAQACVCVAFPIVRPSRPQTQVAQMLSSDQQQRQYAAVQRPDSGQPQAGGNHSSAETSPGHSNATGSDFFMFDELSSALTDERNNGHNHHQQKQPLHHYQPSPSANGSSPASSSNSGSTNSLLSNGDSLMARINQLNQQQQQQQQYGGGRTRSPPTGATVPVDGSTIGVVASSPTNTGQQQIPVSNSLAQQHQHMLAASVALGRGGGGGASFAQRGPIDATDGTTASIQQQQYGGGGAGVPQFHNSFAHTGHHQQQQQQHKAAFYQSQQQHQQHHLHHQQNIQLRPGFGEFSLFQNLFHWHTVVSLYRCFSYYPLFVREFLLFSFRPRTIISITFKQTNINITYNQR